MTLWNVGDQMNHRHYIVGIDGSLSATRALEWTARLATETQASITTIHAWEYPFAAMAPAPIGIAVPPAEAITEASKVALSETVADVRENYSIAIKELVVEGYPSSVLLNEAERRDCDLLVIGTRGRSAISQVLFGSVSRRVVNNATCPVVVLTEEAPLDFSDGVVVGFDGSPHSVAALQWALELPIDKIKVVFAQHTPVALSMDGVIASHVETHEAGLSYLDHLLKEHVPLTYLARIDRVVIAGDPRTVLAEASQGAGLLVVGARGHGRFASAMLGSVSTYVALHSTAAVAVISKDD